VAKASAVPAWQRPALVVLTGTMVSDIEVQTRDKAEEAAAVEKVGDLGQDVIALVRRYPML